MKVNQWVACLEYSFCVYFSSVHMEESSVMQGAQGVLVQNWPTASSAAGKNRSSYFHLNNFRAPPNKNRC